MAADTRQIAEKLHALKAAYDQQLGPRIGALESALAEIAAAGDAAGQIAAVGNLLELAHKIADSAGTFGHPKLSAAASDLEGLCERIGKQGQMPNSENSKELTELVAACRAFAEA